MTEVSRGRCARNHAGSAGCNQFGWHMCGSRTGCYEVVQAEVVEAMAREPPSLEEPASKRSRISCESSVNPESHNVEGITTERLNGSDPPSREFVGRTGLPLKSTEQTPGLKAVKVERPDSESGNSFEVRASSREASLKNRSVTRNALQVHDVGVDNSGAADSEDLLCVFERLLAKKSQEVAQLNRGSRSSLAGMMGPGRSTIGRILADVMARERKQLPLFNEEDSSDVKPSPITNGSNGVSVIETRIEGGFGCGITDHQQAKASAGEGALYKGGNMFWFQVTKHAKEESPLVYCKA